MKFALKRRLRVYLPALVAATASARPVSAVILYSGATRNTSAPTGTLSNSGWQYEGQFGSFLGTPIGSHYFITAKHIGGDSNRLVYNGQEYFVTTPYDAPNADLRIWHVRGAFPSYAPLYSGSSETALGSLLLVGRGTQRGAAIVVGGVTKGWQWGLADGVQSWGQNSVATVVNGGSAYGQLFQLDFNAGVMNEGAISTGDSGGGEFVNDGGVWKLAGINFSAEGPYNTTNSGSGFNASIYDQSGLWVSNGAGGWVSAGTGPGQSFGTRISANISWINSILDNPEPTWNVNAGGNWLTATNWNPEIPLHADSIANFTGAITGAATINVDAPITIGTINFANANTYTLVGPTQALYFDADHGPARINVTQGSHRFLVPVELRTDTTMNVAGSCTLTIGGTFNVVAGVDLTKAGSGTLIINGSQTWTNLASLNVNSGTASVGNFATGGAVTVSAGARLNANHVRASSLTVNGSAVMNADSGNNGVGRVNALNIAGATNAWTGKLDLNANSMVIDAATTTPLTNVTNQLKQGYNNGAWNGSGIASSAAAATAAGLDRTALGVALSTDLFSTFPATWKGQSIDSTAILIRYAYSGDANLDGNVDSIDFNNLAANFGGTGRRWFNGDFNYDSSVDTLDFNSLAANFGSTLPAADTLPSVALVPEPALGGLAMIMLTCARSLRTRARRAMA